jgi:hypothetical protein
VRVDHVITDKQRFFARYTRNDRRESRNAIYGEVNSVIPSGNYLFRKNDGITYDHTYTQSANSLWDVRAGWQQFREPNVRQHEGIFDPATLGFSPSVTALFGGAQYFPGVTFDTLSGIGDNLAANTTHTIYSVQPTYTRLMGTHSMRAGYDLRLYHEFGSNFGRQAGEYTNARNSAFTRQFDNSTGQNFQDVAGFLLGLPTGGAIEINATRLNDTWYHGMFVQDDWKVNERLTVNLGLRYEYEAATTDSENRNVRGFDPAATLGITGAAESAYAANPIPQVPASAFKVRGGLLFASDQNPGFWNADKNNLEPRAGFAYRLSGKTVLRGGWGIYTVPNIIFGNVQTGFSQSTPLIASQDRGLTFVGTLSNPWPAGALQPVGNTQGVNTFLGQSLTRFAPLGLENAQNMRYLVNVQRELPGQWLLEVGYTGSKGYNLTADAELNAIPAQYLSTSQIHDQATIDFLAQLVPNPFFNLLPTGFNAATVAALAAAAPVPAVQQRADLGDDGSSPTTPRR